MSKIVLSTDSNSNPTSHDQDGIQEVALNSPKSNSRVKKNSKKTTSTLSKRTVGEVLDLPNTNDRYKKMFDSTSVGFALLDKEGEISKHNETFVSILGYDNQTKGRQLTWSEIVPAQYLEHDLITLKNALHYSQVVTFERDLMRHDSTLAHVLLGVVPYADSENVTVCFILDLSEQRRAEQALKESQQLLQSITDTVPSIIYIMDLDQAQSLYVNSAITRVLGYSPEQVVAFSVNNFADIVHPDDIEPWKIARSELAQSNETGKIVEYEIRMQDVAGLWRVLRVRDTIFNRDHKSRPKQILGTMEDFTERKKMENQLKKYAYYDSITQLPNRNLILEKLAEVQADQRQFPEKHFAVLVIDLDRFKIINDSLGHDVGDALLLTLAERLKKSIDYPRNIVARLGGDEFIILLTSIQDMTDAEQIAARVQEIFEKPFVLENHEIYVTASIGMVEGLASYTKPEELLRDADTAMYQAKLHGRSRFEVFDANMHTQMMSVLNLENELRRAMDRQELVLYYQPIISTQTGMITGCEALVRWQHPTRGLLLPSEFIPIAEETGLILPIDNFALQTAIHQNGSWQEAGLPHVSVAVNFSVRQLMNKNLISNVDALLKKTGMNPKYLKVEVTESVLIDNAELVINTLLDLKNIGIEISIDDFGTGYSSLTYLKILPINLLKIDRSFVQDATKDKAGAAIAKAVINLAQDLNLSVVAEGVEFADQLEFLQKRHCDFVQGFLFSEPLHAEDFQILLAKQKPLLTPRKNIGVS